MKIKQPKTAAVIWYSQTGNTARYGECIAASLTKQGIKPAASDYREFDKFAVPEYDLIFVGTPVFYYDVPENFQNWLNTIPKIDGKPVSAFVSFGGEGGNQYNTACSLLDIMVNKGGIPVNMGVFGNMSTYPPTLTVGNVKRTLKYKHLPNETTYSEIENFTMKTIENINQMMIIDTKKEAAVREIIKGGIAIFWGAKIFTYSHGINKSKCIRCGTCTEKCPTGAINHEKNSVLKNRCIYCYGCINNCPADAVNMTYLGKKVCGYRDFVKKHNIKITSPEIISGA